MFADGVEVKPRPSSEERTGHSPLAAVCILNHTPQKSFITLEPVFLCPTLPIGEVVYITRRVKENAARWFYPRAFPTTPVEHANLVKKSEVIGSEHIVVRVEKKQGLLHFPICEFSSQLRLAA